MSQHPALSGTRWRAFPKQPLLGVLALAAWAMTAVSPALAQPEQARREYATPGLVVETGARTGACDVLTFTPDGNYLLAAGDDKVVRNWKFTEQGLELSDLPTLRWTIFRESRGNIYALDLSPDKDKRYVAIAGNGIYGGFTVVVLDHKTAEVKYSLKGSAKDQTQHGSIWAIAFSPDGRQVAFGTDRGAVWVWELESGKLRHLGDHGRRAEGGAYNYVVLLTYLTPGQLVSIAENGEVVRWGLGGQGQGDPEVLFRFKGPALRRVALSADRRWLAGGYQDNKVEIYSFPDGQPGPVITLPQGELPRSLAFDAKGERLAVGIEKHNPKASFLQQVNGRIDLYDLTQQPPKRSAGPTPTFYAEALAFHPHDRNLLAVADGNDYEVSVWNLSKLTKVGEVVSPGSSLWGVSLSEDGHYLAMQTQRAPVPASPNARGAGPWKFFDLHLRRWEDKQPFRPAPPREEAGGWRVWTRLEGRKPDGHTWYVQHQDGPAIPLPWDHKLLSFPRCYAFLPATKDKPVRLAVGHYWGISIFDLTGDGVRLSRMLRGHEGEVMALAVTPDQKRLVSVSRDQTVAGWSLEDWPSHPTLGAVFFEREGKLLVGNVDTGSPIWEAGLSPGDEVLLLVVADAAGRHNKVFNRAPQHGKNVGSVRDALDSLQRPVPNKELYFAWKRPGEAKLVEQLTTVVERPLWRFFPTKKGDWVLWRWRDYYYDASTTGDFNIGWQRSFDINKAPVFYRAEQFRKQFQQPEKVATMLAFWKGVADLVHFAQIEPPKVEMTTRMLKDGGLEVTLSAEPKGPLQNQQLARVLLWVNDFQFRSWQQQALTVDKDGAFRITVTVPADKLRKGPNLVTVQCYNRGGLRSEASPRLVTGRGSASAPNLYGLFAGVDDYRQLDRLNSAKDAKALVQAWLSREKSFGKPAITILLDHQVTPKAVLGELDVLSQKVGPDDLLVFYLGGHGVRLDDLRKKVPAAQLQGLSNFLFCCPEFDFQDLTNTTLGFDQVYDRLVRLPCHKVVLLDTCASGTARTAADSASNPIRVLTKDGIGPIIVAACQPHESAQEVLMLDQRKAYSLFSVALRRTLQDTRIFDRADSNHDGELQAEEMADFVQTQVVTLIQGLRAQGMDELGEQNPDIFLPLLEKRLVLARK